VISGFVRGIGPEYYSTAVNPTHSRERFYEAADLIVRAWTEPGPFAFDGRFYRYPFVNPWPRPLQKPHPPIWCPSQGSTETLDWAAQRRYPYLMVFSPLRQIAQVYAEYREACHRHGYTASRYQLTVNVPIVVAESDAKAEEIARRNALWIYHTGLRMPATFWQPPGYLTEASFRRARQAGARLPTELMFEDLIEGGYLICGSPATVRDRLRVFADDLKAGILCSGFAAGVHEATLEMMELFAREVMPHFREDAKVDETAGAGR
jgi:alkanesulfonate monooxygenase SsuD/methylene tetrahydromethanopterin reductase-like flavin-dependent oxidoreductase (luciferase family)